MIKYEDIKKIASNIDFSKYDFDFIGIRIQDEIFEQIGEEINHNSKVWEDGNETDEELDGICAINAKTTQYLPKSVGGYIGNVVIILGSNDVEYGQDEEELIMKNAIVLDIIG